MKSHKIEFLYLSQEDLPRGDSKECHPVDPSHRTGQGR